MTKKEAIQKTLEGKKVCHKKCPYGWVEWHNCFNRWQEDDGNDFIWMEHDETDGWEIYEEPKKEAPDHIDIEVKIDEIGLRCIMLPLATIIGKIYNKHDTRYFATSYVHAGTSCYPIMYRDNKPTFASHVRFVREDLLGGIPNESS